MASSKSSTEISETIYCASIGIVAVLCAVVAYQEYQAGATQWCYFFLFVAAVAAVTSLVLLPFAPPAPYPMPFGDARLANHQELTEPKLIGSKFGEGIRVGEFENGEVIRYRGPGHLLTVASTGSGKFRDILCAAALEFGAAVGAAASAIFIDCKGQIGACTRRQREKLGRFFAVNPFGLWPEELGPPARFNPMTSLDPESENFAEDCDNLADAIIEADPKAENIWVEGGLQFVSGGIAYLASAPNLEPEQRTLGYLRQRIARDCLAFAQEAVKNGSDLVIDRLARFAEATPANRTIGSIIDTVITQTKFLGNASIARNLSASDFDFRELRTMPTTVDIVLPFKYLRSQSKWFRLLIASSLSALIDVGHGLETLLLIDEFGNLGRLGAITDNIALAREYRLHLWVVLQSLQQAKANYGDVWENFVSQADIRQFFGIGDNFSAEYISKLSGQTTVATLSSSTNTAADGQTGSTGESIGMAARRLYLPDQIMGMRQTSFLMRAANLRHIVKGSRRAYWDCPELDGLFDPDPHHKRSAA